jgi:hypothetical protein
MQKITAGIGEILRNLKGLIAAEMRPTPTENGPNGRCQVVEQRRF